MKRAISLAFLAAAGLALATAARAQSQNSYEPQQRLRTALDTCLKTEVMQGAYCVQKCSAGFRLNVVGGKPKCVGQGVAAKHEPPKPAYTPPREGTRKPPPPGA